MRLKLKQLSGLVPIFMSASATMLVLVYLAIFGKLSTPNGDEGLAARLFQLLLVIQIPFIIYFIGSNYKDSRKQTIEIFILQIVSIILAIAPVFIVENLL